MHHFVLHHIPSWQIGDQSSVHSMRARGREAFLMCFEWKSTQKRIHFECPVKWHLTQLFNCRFIKKNRKCLKSRYDRVGLGRMAFHLEDIARCTSWLFGWRESKVKWLMPYIQLLFVWKIVVSTSKSRDFAWFSILQFSPTCMHNPSWSVASVASDWINSHFPNSHLQLARINFIRNNWIIPTNVTMGVPNTLVCFFSLSSS